MRIISKEEEDAHYKAVVKGGLIGGTAGLGIGLAGVVLGYRRWPAFRNLTLPFRSFLVTSSSTFASIVAAENASVRFHRDPQAAYKGQTELAVEQARQQASGTKRFMEWGREHRYDIVFGSWVASMGIALGLVGRNRFLTTSQKLVQARMYAQGLTLAVLIASAVFETSDARSGKGRWETVMVLDPDDPEHKHLIEKKIHKEDYEGQDLWKDMVAAEERRLAARQKSTSQGSGQS